MVVLAMEQPLIDTFAPTVEVPILPVTVQAPNTPTLSDEIDLALASIGQMPADWDASSRAQVQAWNERETQEHEAAVALVADYTEDRITHEEFREMSPQTTFARASSKTEYQLTGTPKVTKTARFFGRKAFVTSDEIAESGEHLNFDLRARVNEIHEELYWQDVEQLTQEWADANPILAQNKAKLDEAVQGAMIVASESVPSEFELLGGKNSFVEDKMLKPEGMAARALDKLGRVASKIAKWRPITKLQVLAGQLQTDATSFLEARKLLKPTGFVLGGAAVASVVAAGYYGASQLVPSESDLFHAAARLIELE